MIFTPEKTEKLRAWGIDIGLLLLRVWLGCLMAFGHGWGKFQKVLDGNFEFGDPIGLGPELSLTLAASAELLCSLLVVVGLGTRLALIPLVFTMCVAAFIAHGPDPFGKKEKALLYLGPFAALIAMGPGRLSLDHLLARKFAKKAAATDAKTED